MIRISSLLLILLSVFALSACDRVGGHSTFRNAKPQIVAQPDAVNAMLAEAATKASNALQTLASVEAVRTPTPSAAPIGRAPAPLRRAITVNWVGPIEQITKTLADRSSYTFSAIGTAPPVPIVVSIDAENKPVIEVLRDIGLQMGKRADIKVDSGNALVEIHYPPIAGVDGLDF